MGSSGRRVLDDFRAWLRVQGYDAAHPPIACVPSGENRSHGSSLGNKLRPYCNGTRFRYAFR